MTLYLMNTPDISVENVTFLAISLSSVKVTITIYSVWGISNTEPRLSMCFCLHFCACMACISVQRLWSGSNIVFQSSIWFCWWLYCLCKECRTLLQAIRFILLDYAHSQAPPSWCCTCPDLDSALSVLSLDSNTKQIHRQTKENLWELMTHMTPNDVL